VKLEGTILYSATYGGIVYQHDTENPFGSNLVTTPAAGLGDAGAMGMGRNNVGEQTQEERDPASTIVLRPPPSFPASEFGIGVASEPTNNFGGRHRSLAKRAAAPTKGSTKPFFQCTTIGVRNGLLAAGSAAGLTGLWQIDSPVDSSVPGTGIALWADHMDKVNALEWVGDEMIYTVGDDGYFRARNLAADALVHSFSASASPISCMATRGPDVVYLGTLDGEVLQIDLRAESCVNIFKPTELEPSPIRCLLLSDVNVPRESYGDRRSALNQTEAEQQQQQKPQTSSKTTVRSTQRGSASTTGKKKATKPDPSAADFQQATVLYVSHGYGEIKAWDLRQPRVLLASFAGHSDPVCSMALSEGMLITGGDNGRIRIYDAGRGNQVDVLSGHRAGITSIVAAGGMIYTGSYDKTVRQYSLADVQRAARLRIEEERRLQRELALHQQQLNDALASSAHKSKKSKKGNATKK